MIRVPYTTTARLFRDSPLTTTIRWYKVPRENGTLQLDTQVNSGYWEWAPWTRKGVGEVWESPKRYDTRQPPVIGPTDHICGTPEDFLFGCEYNDQLPPVAYDQDGVPACCRPGPGGVIIGGSAVLADPTTAGAVVIGGGVDLADIGAVVIGGGAELVEGGGVVVTGDSGGYPVPGATCATAAPIDEGETYLYSISSGSHWFETVATATGDWHVTTTGVGTGEVTIDVFVGGVCPIPTPVAFVVTGPPCWDFAVTAGDVIRLRFNWVSGTPDYSFETGTGPC